MEGLLLYNIPWTVGTTFNDIIRSYVRFIDGLGDHVVVVFDGYLMSNTKDQCHRRRNPIQSMEIHCTADMKLDCRKDLFLSNSSNKQTFVDLLALKLNEVCHTTLNHEDHADTLIVQAGFELLN